MTIILALPAIMLAALITVIAYALGAVGLGGAVITYFVSANVIFIALVIVATRNNPDV